jgi:hypothetical protein
LRKYERLRLEKQDKYAMSGPRFPNPRSQALCLGSKPLGLDYAMQTFSLFQVTQKSLIIKILGLIFMKLFAIN